MSNRPVRWVCNACGKHSDKASTIGDESCWMWAVEVFEDSISWAPDNRVARAEATNSGNKKT